VENKQTKLLTVMAAVLVIMVLVIRFIEPPEDTPEGPTPVVTTGLVEVQPDQVERLTLITPEGTLLAERSEGGWLIVEPAMARGDDAALEDLIRLVDGLQAEPPIVGADPGRYGLDDPAATLILVTRDGLEHRLEAGIDSPMGVKGYVRFNGGDVQVSSTQPRASLARPFEIYIDRRVVSMASSAVSALSWSSADEFEGSWTLSKRGDHWFLPDGRRAKDGAVEGLLAMVRSMRFEGIDTQAQAQEGPPRASLIWQDELGERRIVFLAAGPLGMNILAPDGRTGSISDFEAMAFTSEQLLEDRLVAIYPSGLLRMELHLGELAATWTIAPDGSWLRDGQPDPGQGRAVFEIATSAAGDRVTEVPSPSTSFGWVELDNGYETVRVTLAQEQDGGRVVVPAGGEPPFWAPASSIDLLSGLFTAP
jgi:hypothetical protein